MAPKKFIAATILLALCAGVGVWVVQDGGAVGFLTEAKKLIGWGRTAEAAGGASLDKKGPGVRSVRVVKPEPASETSTLTLSARTAPAEQAYILSRVSGVVAERRVDIGDRVEAGDVLLRIEAPEVDQELMRARAAVRQIEARLTLATLEFGRAEVLVPKGHVSVQIRDERFAAKLTAEADLAAARAEVKRLEEIQSFQTVRAPFAGTIIARQVERGNKVTANQTQSEGYLLRIGRLEELRLEIDVPQSSSLKVGAGTGARVAFAELPGETFNASVGRSSGLIDSSSGTMRVEFLMPNPERRIPAGLIGQVKIDVSDAKGSVLVPTNTIVTRAGRQAVIVVDNQGVVRVKPIVVDRDLGERVVVTSGLTTGDRVVISPNALLREGDKVDVQATKDQGVS
ncbi:efflux RND transporter periplasmic adaptor subunit [Hyphomicrobium sp.]|uniref:efflux RND transporter periplasmic adaptor subunit n=1 Tax=Hyphomicrobium sp. TaxID=82 RepID=UPI001DFA9897|nr:efflux RND transporter periplasmic adaptor subunit [Hyphomicrobium sp.]MBY0558732.1 efflux RND transporter periplasmic adaptor subunit [Hyphomicrobium sp.]